MEYRATGTLIDSRPTSDYVDGRRIHWVLVQRGEVDANEWVVSRYVDGACEWIQGHYFFSIKEAVDYSQPR